MSRRDQPPGKPRARHWSRSMGAAAFIMAEVLSVPYTQVILAGIIPALLFYLGVLFQVHLRALRMNLFTDTKGRHECRTDLGFRSPCARTARRAHARA